MSVWIARLLCLPLFSTLPFLCGSVSLTCLSLIFQKGSFPFFLDTVSNHSPPDPPHVTLEGCCECVITWFLCFKSSPQCVSLLISALPVSLSPCVLLSQLVLLNVTVLIIMYECVQATTVLVCCGHLCPVRCPPPCAILPCLCQGGAYRNAKRFPHKQNMDSVQTSPPHKPTLKHLLLTGLLSLVLPWGELGVGQGERHTAVAPHSLLCRPAPIALFFSVSTKEVYNKWCHLDKVI